MDKIAASIARIATETGEKPVRPMTDPHAELLPAGLSADLFLALDRCRDDHPDIGDRAEMIRFILRDWLADRGYLHRLDDPAATG